MRAFVRWLIANKHADASLRLSELRDAKKVLRSFTDQELVKFIKFRPKTFTERRTHTLVLLLINTGVRIDEALSLTRDDLDFDNLMIKVQGKGSKERLVPMSYELRAAFIRFLNLSVHKFELIFPTSQGTRQYYGDVYRMFTKLCRRLGIKPIGFHCCRRTYARNYLKSGGNLFYLQTSMGHSKLETTRRYVEVEPEALKKAHLQTSTLSRLK